MLSPVADRKAIAPADARASFAAFESDLASGFLAIAPADVPAIIAEAQRPSELSTLTGGHRSFDLLHVAAALSLQASTFLSFDQNQRKLATTVKLTVAP